MAAACAQLRRAIAHSKLKSVCADSSAFAVGVRLSAPQVERSVGADSLFKRSPNAAALCSARLESHACMSRAAASWLGITSVGVLPMAGSASTMLDARIDAL